MATAAQNLLHWGLSHNAAQFPEVFRVDGFANSFTGMIEESEYSNDLTTAGFLPGQAGTLYVQEEEFLPVNLTPWPGMRLFFRGRGWLTTAVGFVPGRWRLSLEHTGILATDPGTQEMLLGDSTGQEIEFTSGVLAVR